MPTHPVPAVDGCDGDGMSEAELVDAIRSLEDLKARACAAQARLTRRLDVRVRDRHRSLGVPAARRSRDVAGLVAFARRESPARGSRFLGLARALTELPHTEAAMAAGVLSEWRATLIARETSCLAAPDRATVDQQVSGRRPDGSYPFDGWGDTTLSLPACDVAWTDVLSRRERRGGAWRLADLLDELPVALLICTP